MNIGGGQIRGALFNFFVVKSALFCIFWMLPPLSKITPDDVICNIGISADDTTLYSKCDQASDLWQQLELASELESDLPPLVLKGGFSPD